MRNLEIATSTGPKRVECFWRGKSLAVTRVVDGEGWRISHVISGYAMPWTWGVSPEPLRDVARTLELVADWDHFWDEPRGPWEAAETRTCIEALEEMFGVRRGVGT